MKDEEVIRGLKVLRKDFSGYKPNEEMFDAAIEAVQERMERKTGKWIRTDKAIRIVRKYLGYSDEKPYDTVDAIVDDIMDEADKEVDE